MNATKPTNAVVALADLLSETVREYEQRLAGQQDAINAVGAQLKETSAALQASKQRASEAMLLMSELERGMNAAESPIGCVVQTGSRDVVSRWLKEIAECLTPPLQSPPGPNGGPSRPPT